MIIYYNPILDILRFFYLNEWRSKNSSALGKLATGGVEVCEVEGYHHNLFEEPQVSVLGEQIKYCLEKTHKRKT
ncbi:hypothetical protein [Candidatus Parabeggiatoa sp. HSG14]|uniref:hypothetical protein n=1 Tax=Candidatus Parabeggiatoa sp. HSG14 TaxID=3055593 RepID=UPI0025A6ED90|nr:hypothetical protein [Thiotrichales bacterium HSG14]